MQQSKPRVSSLMHTFSSYVAGAARLALPAHVREHTKMHLLDTLASIVSGSRLNPGKTAIAYASKLGGVAEAGVPGTGLITSAANAAFAGGMAAHADETDDSHQPSNTHPGCAVIPAALAMAEREKAGGQLLLRAIAAGYDANCRLTLAFNPAKFKIAGFSNHSFGGVFGASVAAAVIARLKADQVRHVLSYAAQQSAGLRTFERDKDHILKAFVLGGMTARNGVAGATMVQHGFTGVDDEFSGPRKRNLFDIYAPDGNPVELIRDLGAIYEVTRTTIKKWSVGSPNQAALDSLEWLMQHHTVHARNLKRLVVTTPDNEAMTVNNSEMPDICMQHLLALMIVDGTVTFESCHQTARMRDPRVLAVRKRITLVPSAALTRAKPHRQAIIEIETADGGVLRRHTRAVSGTPENPMSCAEIERKSLDLMAPILGSRRARRMIDAVW